MEKMAADSLPTLVRMVTALETGCMKSGTMPTEASDPPPSG